MFSSMLLIQYIPFITYTLFFNVIVKQKLADWNPTQNLANKAKK